MSNRPANASTPPASALPQSLRTGIAAIDREHDLIYQALRTAMVRAGAAQDAPQVQLESLMSTLRNHFDSEEAFMASQGYPALEQHRQHHRAYFERAARSLQSLRRGAPLFDTLVALLDAVMRDAVEDDLEFVNWADARRLSRS